jgi:putative transposase
VQDIWACDFLQTYDLYFRTVFVFIELGSRHVVHFAVTRSPTDAWVAQQIREATPFDTLPRFFIRDTDCKYGTEFARAVSTIEVVRTPHPRSQSEYGAKISPSDSQSIPHRSFQ